MAADAEKWLRLLYDELASVHTDLNAVEAHIAEAGDIPKLLQEVRRKRIERVRAERTAKREVRLKKWAEAWDKETKWRQTTLPFLGAGVSSGLVYDTGNPEKLTAHGLPLLISATDVAAAIGIDERALGWLTYHRSASAIDHYSRFLIPKRRGGTRVISSPKRRLRAAQSWLLEGVLTPLPVHDAAYAFRPGRSVADNARQHAGRAVVARLDLKDFFPSVSLPRVRRFFQQLGCNGGVAILLTLTRKIIAETGFVVNEDKTAVLRPQHRQVVTGVVVNTAPHVSRTDLRRFRAVLHRCETQGFAVVTEQMGRDARAYASGYLAFLHMVCPIQADRLREKHPWITQWQKAP